jgi:hypothetical protein
VLANGGGSDAGGPVVDIGFGTWISNDEVYVTFLSTWTIPTDMFASESSNKTVDVRFNYTTSSQYVGIYTYHDRAVSTSNLVIYKISFCTSATNVGGATVSPSREGTGFYLHGGPLAQCPGRQSFPRRAKRNDQSLPSQPATRAACPNFSTSCP